MRPAAAKRFLVDTYERLGAKGLWERVEGGTSNGVVCLGGGDGGREYVGGAGEPLVVEGLGGSHPFFGVDLCGGASGVKQGRRWGIECLNFRPT